MLETEERGIPSGPDISCRKCLNAYSELPTTLVNHDKHWYRLPLIAHFCLRLTSLLRIQRQLGSREQTTTSGRR